MAVTLLRGEGLPLTSQSPRSSAPAGRIPTAGQPGQSRGAGCMALWQGKASPRPLVPRRKPGRLPWERSLFIQERENPIVKTPSPHPDTAGHSPLVSQQAATNPLGTAGVLSWTTPPSRQRITRQGLVSPGQLAASPRLEARTFCSQCRSLM